MKHLIIISLLFLLPACATYNAYTEQVEEIEALPEAFDLPDDYQYRIRKGDKITVSVWGMDELSVGSTYGIYNSNEVYGKWLMVDFMGNIEVPKVGTVNVLNKTIIELKEDLKSKVAEWVKIPVVDVKILNREITVLGEVRDPQVILVDKEENYLLEILARCKGFDAYADIKQLLVLRQFKDDVHVAKIDLTVYTADNRGNLKLLPGDVVIIPSRKYKNFDKRVSTIIPFTSTMTAAAILMGAF